MQEVIDIPMDLSHLTPAAQQAVMLPDVERIDKIRATRWIGYTRAQQAIAALENLLTWPDRQRMQNLLLIGETNNGKSRIIERFRREHLPRISEDGSKEIIPILVMQMPSGPTIARFYTMLLYAMNAPISGKQRFPELEILSLRLMKETQVCMLVIDELHNMLSGRPAVRHEFLNLLRFLGNTLCIPIAGLGTDEAYRAIRTDPQLENRFNLLFYRNGKKMMSLPCY